LSHYWSQLYCHTTGHSYIVTLLVTVILSH